MRSGTTKIVASNRCAVLSPTGDGPHEKELIDCHIAVENVASRQRVLALHIERRDHLTVDDSAAEPRRILVDCRDASVGESIFFSVPVSVPELVRSILGEHAHYVFTRRRDRIVVCGWNSEFKQRILRRPSGGRLFPTAIYIIHRRTDVNRRPVLRAQLRTGIRAEAGKAVESEIDLERTPLNLDLLDVRSKVTVEIARIQQLQEADLGIDIGDHKSRV